MNRRLEQPIVDELKRIIKDKNITLSEIAEATCIEMGISQFTAKKFTENFTSGYLYGEQFRKQHCQKELEYLRRAAIVLDYLEISSRDPLIITFRQFDPRFKYPVKSSLKKPKTQYGQVSG